MITLSEAKLHLRVDGDDEDTLIEGMIEAAIETTAQYLNVDYGDLTDDPLIPAPVQAAMLLMVGDLYMNREGVAERQLFINPTYERLLAPYRVMGV